MPKPQQKAQQLAKFLTYILGRRPDEFGLVTDADGFVTIKSLLQALGEEEGWRYVRRKDIDSLSLLVPELSLEQESDRIRTKEQKHLPVPQVKMNLPKLLYICVRRRAWPVVATHGLGVEDPEKPELVVTADQEMALRRGRRIDPDPVLLTIHTSTAQEMGALFKQYGETLYLTSYVPVEGVSGPPLPKEEPQRKKAKPKVRPQTPGSFALRPQNRPDDQDDAAQDPAGRSRDQRRRKEKQWQREKPPWRK